MQETFAVGVTVVTFTDAVVLCGLHQPANRVIHDNHCILKYEWKNVFFAFRDGAVAVTNYRHLL